MQLTEAVPPKRQRHSSTCACLQLLLCAAHYRRKGFLDARAQINYRFNQTKSAINWRGAPLLMLEHICTAAIASFDRFCGLFQSWYLSIRSAQCAQHISNSFNLLLIELESVLFCGNLLCLRVQMCKKGSQCQTLVPFYEFLLSFCFCVQCTCHVCAECGSKQSANEIKWESKANIHAFVFLPSSFIVSNRDVHRTLTIV